MLPIRPSVRPSHELLAIDSLYERSRINEDHLAEGTIKLVEVDLTAANDELERTWDG